MTETQHFTKEQVKELAYGYELDGFREEDLYYDDDPGQRTRTVNVIVIREADGKLFRVRYDEGLNEYEEQDAPEVERVLAPQYEYLEKYT